MSVIVLTSGPGSPGVTTTSLGLTLCWPGDVMLSDCDRDPAQAIPAGYLRGLDLGGRGLAVLARLHREARGIGPELIRQTIALTREETTNRRFLPGFAQPGAVRLFDHIWPELAEAFTDLGTQGIDVIVDAGRLGHDGLPTALLEVADAIGFVLQSNLKSLAASRPRTSRGSPTGTGAGGPGAPLLDPRDHCAVRGRLLDPDSLGSASGRGVEPRSDATQRVQQLASPRLVPGGRAASHTKTRTRQGSQA